MGLISMLMLLMRGQLREFSVRLGDCESLLYNELCKTRVLIGLEECVIRV